jgi:hypothetical protein
MPIFPSRITVAISFPALDRFVDFLEKNDSDQAEVDKLAQHLGQLNDKLSLAVDNQPKEN